MTKVKNFGFLASFRRLGLALGWVVLAGLTGCATTAVPSIPVTELDSFTAAPVTARVMNDVKIRWEIRDDVQQYCARAAQINLASGKFTPPLACAIWNVSSKECVIVTGRQVTHVALGHEMRHCFEGSFHR